MDNNWRQQNWKQNKQQQNNNKLDENCIYLKNLINIIKNEVINFNISYINIFADLDQFIIEFIQNVSTCRKTRYGYDTYLKKLFINLEALIKIMKVKIGEINITINFTELNKIMNIIDDTILGPVLQDKNFVELGEFTTLIKEKYPNIPEITWGFDDFISEYNYINNKQCYNINKEDMYKHGAIYMPISENGFMPQELKALKFFKNNKFDEQTFKKYLEAIKYCKNNKINDVIPNEVDVDAEIMILNKSHNTIQYNNNDCKCYVAVHGTIILTSDETKLEESDLETICDSFHCEGFVAKIIEQNNDSCHFNINSIKGIDNDMTKTERTCFKIRHQCFPTIKDGIEVPKKSHPPPTINDFTKEGYELCEHKNYERGAIPQITERVIIATNNINNKKFELVAIPLVNAIKNQSKTKGNSKGKIVGIYDTTGDEKTYRYNLTKLNKDILGKDFVLELKFDGETIILYKTNGTFYIKVRKNVNVFRVNQNGQIKYLLGWTKS